MAVFELGGNYINTKHISCVGVKDGRICGRICGEKSWYDVYIVCYGYTITRAYKTKSEAEEIAMRIANFMQEEDNNGLEHGRKS